MGGDGSGRKPDVIKMMQKQEQKFMPIASTNSEPIFLPNYSGVKPEALKTSFQDNKSIVTGTDDGTYITFYFNTTPIFRIEKATSQIQVIAGIDTDTSIT